MRTIIATIILALGAVGCCPPPPVPGPPTDATVEPPEILCPPAGVCTEITEPAP